MYNDLYLGEVNFWREYLADGQPRIILDFGLQSAIIIAKSLEFDVRWAGIEDDDKAFTNQIGQEDLFSLADLNRALDGERFDWDELEDEEMEISGLG